MVTAAVLGSRGMLGSVVARRWAEHGAEIRTAAEHVDYLVNCIRPDDLLRSVQLAYTGGLIQPSTDAIAEDTEYARRKRTLEQLLDGMAVVIRAGIVDIRHEYPVAFTNWTCNPLTPLEWADLAWEFRDSPGIHPDGREPLSRYEVAASVAAVFERDFPQPGEAPEPLDRVMPSHGLRPPLLEALRAYRDWLGC